MESDVLRIVRTIDEVRSEFGRQLTRPLYVVWCAAVIPNPFASVYVDDISELRATFSTSLGKLLATEIYRLLSTIGESCEPEGYGKGALVGLNGEVEHGSNIIHTTQFTRFLKEPIAGATPMPSAEKRGPVGASLDLALKSSRDLAIRSHHMTYEVRIPDAPQPHEIVIFICAATGGRPHARSLVE